MPDQKIFMIGSTLITLVTLSLTQFGYDVLILYSHAGIRKGCLCLISLLCM